MASFGFFGGKGIFMKNGAIFDMDGLLFDTEQLYQKYWLEVADEFGVARNPELGKACCGTSGEHMHQVVHSFYPDIDAAAYSDRVVELATKAMERELVAMPGVREILEFFHQHRIPMAVASGSPTYTIEGNLSRTGLRKYFDALIGSEQISNGKPAPDIFLLAAEKIHLPAADCYVFEDGFNGIRAAAAAGCTAVMIPDLLEPTEEIRALCKGVYPSLIHAMEAIQGGEL